MPGLDRTPEVQAQGLGHDAGPVPNCQQRDARADLALDHVRRLGTLRLPQWAFIKLTKACITPLLYGLHTTPLAIRHQDIERLIRHGSWGTARCASNWHLAQALAIPSARLTPKSFKFFESIQLLRQLATQESHRLRLLERWHSGFCTTGPGTWSQLNAIIAETGGHLLPSGGMRWDNAKIELNIHMPRTRFNHCLRDAWRAYHITQTAKTLPFLRPLVSLDWDCARRLLHTHSHAHRTILAHGVNAKSRAYHHHQTGTSSTCEHGCEGADGGYCDDSPEHRLLDCYATVGLREPHFSRQELDFLRRQPLLTTRCSTWALPNTLATLRIPHQQAWGLWPSQGLVSFQ